MIRAILFRVAIFLLPFIIYELYLTLMRLQSRKPVSRRRPWTAIFIAGLALASISLIVEGLMRHDTTDGVYVPPQVVEGKIVPGHVEEK